MSKLLLGAAVAACAAAGSVVALTAQASRYPQRLIGLYPVGNDRGATGPSTVLHPNARDLGRLGLLYLNRGKWKGEQILSESWVDFARTPAPAARDRGREYGGHFWLVPDSRTDLPQDAYSTNGARGRYTVVVPSYDLVVVRRGLDFRAGGRGLSRWDLLAEIITAFPGRTGGAKLSLPTS
jgi:CubicO group peptidase (beta-lactamase class C family)